LWFAGFKYTLAGKAAVYNQLSTILIIILAAAFLGERLSRHRIAAILLALAGGWLVLES
jgi:drug/metabolite transporter (DMT)-like permease